MLGPVIADDAELTLTAEEREALIGLLRRAIDEARYLYSRRYNPIKAILAKLEPAPAAPAPLPPLRPGMAPTHGRGPRRR
jgi:transposase